MLLITHLIVHILCSFDIGVTPSGVSTTWTAVTVGCFHLPKVSERDAYLFWMDCSISGVHIYSTLCTRLQDHPYQKNSWTHANASRGQIVVCTPVMHAPQSRHSSTIGCHDVRVIESETSSVDECGSWLWWTAAYTTIFYSPMAIAVVVV